MTRAIKFILAVMLFGCLLHMPYSYYQLVRTTALVGFALLAYKASEKVDKTEIIVYIFLAVLFQPIFKIALGRAIWNIVDVIVGIGLLASVFLRSKKTEEFISF